MSAEGPEDSDTLVKLAMTNGHVRLYRRESAGYRLERRGLVERIGKMFTITEAGRQHLREKGLMK